MLTSNVYELLGEAGRYALAGALGDRPETAMVVHALARGACRAYLRGTPAQPRAAVVEIMGLPGEPAAFGLEVEELWALLAGLDGWKCVSVGEKDAHALGARMQEAMGRPVRYYREVGLVLARPAARFPHPAVRRLGPADIRLLEDAPSELWAVGYATPAAALAGGYVAGAVVNDQESGAVSLVATAHAHGLVGRYAELGVYTSPAWRRKGLGVSVASVVAQCVQEDGGVPVWGAGHDNTGSLRIAEKVGFEPAFERCFVIRS